jgi:F-type H+-transporting ATPase subunit delta
VLGELLRNPQIETTTKRDALEAALEDASETFRNFAKLVAEKGRAAELEQIHDEWERLLAAEERVLELELTTAVELSDAEAAAIVGKIEQAAGRKIEATRSVDPDLIGGLVLQAGSLRLDGSVRGRLNGLRDELLARG